MTSNSIQSPHNPRVKAWASLLTKKGREKQRKFMIEGVHLVKEALLAKQSPFRIESVLYDQEVGWPAELIQPWEQLGAKPERLAVTEAVIRKCSEAITPQPVAAVMHIPESKSHEATFHRLKEKRDALVLLLDGLQDPGNVGTLIRSAEAANADGVIIGLGSADLYNSKTLRSTMGSVFRLPVWQGPLSAVIERLVQANRNVYAAVLSEQSLCCYDVDWKQGGWLIIGSEGSGVSSELQDLASAHVHIPMKETVESLNAAMAGTVFLYEAFRQRLVK